MEKAKVLQRLKQGQKLSLVEHNKLTLPVLSMAHLAVVIVLILDEIHEADFIVEMPGKADSRPKVITVTNIGDDTENCKTGEDGILIVNSIMESALTKAGGSLIGRMFKISSKGMREGKQYRDIDITEMKLSEAQGA